ncbi:MAG: type II toxin-antitoxin system VapC family toxin [Thiomargarita sp.]|nr:type II toxin-antitoxin system VapC family toxin [Thiomargarita sp.]
MRVIFVDTAAFIALGNQHDDLHKQARNIQKQLAKHTVQFVTTNLVIAEYCNAFSSIKLRSIAITTVETIFISKRWQYIHIDENLMQQSYVLYKKMTDKNWGLVDCSSIVLAKKMQIQEIFTAAHHFEQAGFQILLK